jgi:hypothetical protein
MLSPQMLSLQVLSPDVKPSDAASKPGGQQNQQARRPGGGQQARRPAKPASQEARRRTAKQEASEAGGQRRRTLAGQKASQEARRHEASKPASQEVRKAGGQNFQPLLLDQHGNQKPQATRNSSQPEIGINLK